MKWKAPEDFDTPNLNKLIIINLTAIVWSGVDIDDLGEDYEVMALKQYG